MLIGSAAGAVVTRTGIIRLGVLRTSCGVVLLLASGLLVPVPHRQARRFQLVLIVLVHRHRAPRLSNPATFAPVRH